MLLLWATHVAFTTLCNIQSEKLSCHVTNKGNCNRVSSKNDIFQKRTCNVDLKSITHCLTLQKTAEDKTDNTGIQLM